MIVGRRIDEVANDFFWAPFARRSPVARGFVVDPVKEIPGSIESDAKLPA